MNGIALALTMALLGTSFVGLPECGIPGPPAAELARATAVFSGKVVGRDYVSEETAPGETSRRLVIKIRVARVWKGDIYAETAMYTSEVHLANGLMDSFEEDFRFIDDKEYLVYAFGKPDRLSTTACTRTRELSKADSDLKELGKSHEPKIRN